MVTLTKVVITEAGIKRKRQMIGEQPFSLDAAYRYFILDDLHMRHPAGLTYPQIQDGYGEFGMKRVKTLLREGHLVEVIVQDVHSARCTATDGTEC